MKHYLTVAVLVCTTVCMAVDLYLTPDVILTADTFSANGQLYKIDGIQSPAGEWGLIAKKIMEKMIMGKEFKFLYFPLQKKQKEKIRHVYFGIYGRDGKPQPNASVKLLMMGLAKFENGCVDKNRGKPYRPAEEHARKNSLGIWYKK